jgi:hypothetical protein
LAIQTTGMPTDIYNASFLAERNNRISKSFLRWLLHLLQAITHDGCSSACQLANIPSPQASGRLADIRCFLHLCQRITTCRLHQHLMASSIRSSCRQPIGTNVIALSQVWIQKVSCNSTKGISILIKYSYLFGVSVQW